MTRIWTVIAVSAATLVPATLLDAKEPLHFRFITCCKDEAFFDPVKKGMHDAAEAMKVQCEFGGTPGVDVKLQSELVRKAVDEGCDGIALNIIDAEAFNEVTAEAIRRGVPVVAFNTDARPADKDVGGTRRGSANPRLSGICQHYFEAGKMLGTEALEFIPSGSRVLITQHDRGVASLDDRLRGIQAAIGPRAITAKVICATNDLPQAIELIAAELRASPDIKVVLGTGQTDTEAAGVAIEKHFAGQGYAAAGFDLSPEILRLVKAGVIRLTIDQQPYLQGYFPVVQLALHCRYGIRPSDIDAGAGIIRKDDVDRVLSLSRDHYR